MASVINPELIRIGVLAGEPMRLEGLSAVFDEDPLPGRPRLVPQVGSLDDLLADHAVDYLVIDLNSSSDGLKTLESVRAARPGIRLIVIGPENADELVLSAIKIGARAYLDLTAGPNLVRQAIDVVVAGSIWAPRRLLSLLIDRLLGVSAGSTEAGNLELTDRERQVMKLILLARSNREIAEELGIEERTVKAHVGRLMRKTGAENRIALSMKALNSLKLTPTEKAE